MKYCFVFTLNVIVLFYGSASIAEEIHNPSRWIGVVNATNKAFGWPGSGVTLTFNGSSLSVTLKDSGKNSLIVSDGDRSFRLNLQSGTHTYELAANLPMGAHGMNITRRTEGLFGDTEFVSAATDGTFVPAPEPERRLLIIGDSISAGYGIEGQDGHCPFSADTENQYLTYGAVAGRRARADVTTLAVSGIGVSRNFGGQSTPTMPQMLDKPTPNRAGSNPDQLRTPPVYQAIVINLGTNDFSQGSAPAGFVADYTALLKRLRQLQPTAMIYAALGPMLAVRDFMAAQQAIQLAVTARRVEGDHALAYLPLKNQKTSGTGCDWHPNAAAHVAMADILNQTLQHDLGWKAP